MVAGYVPLFNVVDVDSIGAMRTTLPIVCTLGFTVVSLACLSANAFSGKDYYLVWSDETFDE